MGPDFDNDTNQHDSDEGWLISFTDLIIMLLGFFVIMFSVSTVNSDKYTQMYSAISEMIGKQVPAAMIESGNTPKTNDKKQPSYQKMVKEINHFIKKQSLQKEIQTKVTSRGIKITAFGGLLFDSGKAELSKRAKTFLGNISLMILLSEYYITIEGHTDDIPIKSGYYPSNWELAAARATHVIRYLIENGVPSKQMVAMSYADTQPLKYTYPENKQHLNKNIRAQNRRVVLIISKQPIYSSDL